MIQIYLSDGWTVGRIRYQSLVVVVIVICGEEEEKEDDFGFRASVDRSEAKEPRHIISPLTNGNI